MTAQPKIRPKRSNSPRSSRCAALERHHRAASAELEALARAMCGENQDPALIAQARIIAENNLIRQAIRLEKFKILEQCLAEDRMSEDEYFEQRKERLIAAIFAKFRNHLPPLPRMRERYSCDEIVTKIVEYFDGEDQIALEQFVKEFLDKEPPKPRECDKYEALELVAAELDELERNETRAWSRQMRAIRSLIEHRDGGILN
jgi:hypothetical protein